MLSRIILLQKTFFLFLIIGTFSFAQNTNDALRVGIPGLGANARALGMGNSFISLSDDASAAFFNPAGFGLIKKMEFSGGLSYINYGNDAEFFNETTNYSSSQTKLDRLSFVFPFPTLRGSLVFGLSYHQSKDLTTAMRFEGFNNTNTSMIQDLLNTDIPYDLFLTDEETGTITPIFGRLNQHGSIISSGVINNWTFSGAVEIYKNLFVGLNLNIITGDYESDNEYFEDDVQNIYQGQTDPNDSDTEDFRRFFLNRIINWDISGWDAKFGLLYQLNNNARFGLTVQFPKSFNIKEEFFVDGYSEFGTGFSPSLDRDKYASPVEYDIVTPFELGAGFSVNIVGLILSAQGTLMDYSQMKFENAVGIDATDISTMNKDIKDEVRSVINYNLGLEYTIPVVGLRFRGGYLVQPSPYRDDPSDFDRKYLTAGIGFLADETVGIDIGYAYGWWKDIGDNYSTDESGNFSPGVSRTFQDVTNDFIILTGIYRF